MSRRRHSKGYRINDSEMLLLVRELLKRGARTKTVCDLTQASDLVTREIYFELFHEAPSRGPGPWTYKNYIDHPTKQFDSSLAASIWRHYLDVHARADHTQSPFEHSLGKVYCQAYDEYVKRSSQLLIVEKPLTFEMFWRLGFELERRTVLTWRSCVSCETAFVNAVLGSESHQSHCPMCKMHGNRLCSCGKYVPVDDGDIPPTRAPKCIECARKADRRSTIDAYEAAHLKRSLFSHLLD